jgi:hypothetical protein
VLLLLLIIASMRMHLHAGAMIALLATTHVTALLYALFLCVSAMHNNYNATHTHAAAAAVTVI